MSPWSAARPGDRLTDVDTPALLLDLDAFERNLQRMANALAGRGVRLRAHAKSHKTPEIALRQVALGAVGICCQKVSEAAVFVEAGVRDVLITNEVVGAAKLERLVALASRARIGVLADAAAPVRDLARIAASAGVVIDVYVEVDVGRRCGVPPGEPAAELAALIAGFASLRFAGLHVYHGPAQHKRSAAERSAAVGFATDCARVSRDAVIARGLACETITGAGTGTFLLERDSGIYNEVQAGSYVFMDRDYADNQPAPDDLGFEHALFVRTTVMSRPSSARAIVDAGLKASSVDSGMPGVWNHPGWRYLKASDEHGVIECTEASPPALGEALMLIPGHCDPTVNLYDEIICFRGDRVEAVWPVAARGALL